MSAATRPGAAAIAFCRAIAEERAAQYLPNAVAAAAAAGAPDRRQAFVELAASLLDEADHIDIPRDVPLEFERSPADYARRFGLALLLVADAIDASQAEALRTGRSGEGGAAR